MKRFALAVVPFALAACATVPAGPSKFTAAFAQTATVGGVSVAPVSVKEDSRCPINVRCVWAGRFILTAEIASNGVVQTHNLTLGEPQQIRGGRLTLVAVEPGKMVGDVPPHPMLFTFQLDR